MAKFKLHRETKADRAFVCFCYVCLFLVGLVTLYPFWELAVLSISNRADASRVGFKLFTLHPDFSAYQNVLGSRGIWQAAWNSVVRVVLGTSLSVFLTTLTAYPLSKRNLVFGKPLTMFFIFTMMFSGGLIPSYLLIQDLGLFDNILSLILPSAVSAYNVIIVRNFMRSIDNSIEESAKIDGAGDFRIWAQIIIPLSTPVIATISLWIAVNHWNAYFDALLYMRDTSKYVLQVILRRVLMEQQMDMFITGVMTDFSAKPTEISTRAALIIVSTLPIIVVYPFVQKYFVKGIMLGSVKG